MSLEHDVTYTWSTPSGGSKVTALRKIFGAVASALDTAVATSTYNASAAFSLTLSKALSIFLVSDQAVTFKAGGTNAVQTVSITGSPTGGTFTLTAASQTTAAVAYNATATAVASALNALTAVGAGGVTATGGPLPGTPVVVTFVGQLGLQPVTTMTHADSLTGGSTPAVAIAATTAGVAADTTISLLANVPLVWDSTAYFAQPFAANVANVYVTNISGAGANIKLRALSNA